MTNQNIEEKRIGGRVNKVVLVGQTVRRNTGPWTPTVHQLLTHLNHAGFYGAPRPHGFDELGREILDYIPGQAGGFPLPDFILTDEAIKSYGSLLRAYHDATSTFQIPGDAIWFLPPKEPVEVICHGDLSPENCIFQNGLPVSLIDFDIVHPGPRVWDLGYAAFCFIPLQPPAPGADLNSSIEKQCHRLKLFCDGYRLTGNDRPAVVDNAYARLVHLVEQIEEKAA